MEKFMFHRLCDKKYIGIITILKYEISVNTSLSELIFPSSEFMAKMVIVDLALKSGINKYRFVSFDIDKFGKINLSSNKYINVSNKVLKLADGFLKEKSEIVKNSILPESQKKQNFQYV